MGLVCVLVVTMVFAAYYYTNLESDMRRRAEETASFFTDYLNQNYNDYYQSCITYTRTFEDRNSLELQFINAEGQLVVSSYGHWAGKAPTTSDISDAFVTKDIESYVGADPATGERIIAVSSPMVYSGGEVIGVLRYVTSTEALDRQILTIGLCAAGAFLVILGAVLFSGRYFIRSIVVPVEQITQKAKRIASGSYGVQIQTRYNDEIGELANTVNELSVKLNQNEKMQTDFISSLSHELRTPLTAITGWSETLLSDPDLDDQTRRGMKIIHRETHRLTEMVVELLDFTRIQDGRFTLNVELSDIRGEFEDTVYMYGSRLAQEGITLELTEDDEEIPEIPCDPKRMRQVFLNILDNAAKHGGEGKRIEAAIRLEDEEVVIRIRDYGPGIPADELPLVKRKFYKGSSKVRGTGIGLAVCDEIVELHGGTLTLENAPGGGTVVTVRLPVSQ
ncbi:MAG: HAMP domain-containing protein [Oscillospiraceae bacterium]|nr:HAMP domain-containing protein [Oscillospiraceae bacterium]